MPEYNIFRSKYIVRVRLSSSCEMNQLVMLKKVVSKLSVTELKADKKDIRGLLTAEENGWLIIMSISLNSVVIPKEDFKNNVRETEDETGLAETTEEIESLVEMVEEESETVEVIGQEEENLEETNEVVETIAEEAIESVGMVIEEAVSEKAVSEEESRESKDIDSLAKASYDKAILETEDNMTKCPYCEKSYALSSAKKYLKAHIISEHASAL